MRNRIIPYNPILKSTARKLRRAGNLAEALLWRQLKGRQMRGFDFHRQKPLGDYIVDFFCLELMLAIEVDGSSHNDRLPEDDNRQRCLEAAGVRIVRFTDEEVRRNLNGVIVAISSWIEKNSGERD